MTLDRHRSRLIPDVDLGGDGRLFVADMEGTFPTRRGPKDGTTPPDFDVEERSYRSYDPRREPKRKFRPNEPSRFGEEVKRLSGTLRTQSSSASLQRKLQRLRSPDRAPNALGASWQYDNNHPARHFSPPGDRGTWSHNNQRKAKNKQNRYSSEYPGSIDRKNTKSLDMAAIKDYKERRKSDRPNSILQMYNSGAGSTNGGLHSSSKPSLVRRPSQTAMSKKLADDKLPGVFFIVTGLLLLAVGIAHAVISLWNIAYCMIWTGVLLLIMGIFGVIHRLDYLTQWKNGIYVTAGLTSSVGVMVTAAFILQVAVPIVIMLSSQVSTADIVSLIEFTRSNQTLSIDITVSQTAYGALSLEVIGFVLCLVNLYAMTATVMAFSNHWDAVYTSTSQCDFRGHPKFFNPFEQIIIVQATLLLGIFAFVLWFDRTGGPHHYYSSLWAPCVVFVAALISICHGKREDIYSLGALAMALQFLAVCALTVSAVLVLLGLVDNTELLDKSVRVLERKQLTASCVFDGLYIVCVLINIIFIIGVIFRQMRRVCNCGCCDPVGQP